VLDRLPAWATTGVGSLPYTEGRTAAGQAVKAYDLPFCPQLPRLEGDMVAEWLGADPARCGWSPDRDRQRPRGWEWLLRQLTLRPPSHGIVKLQVTGPLTLARALDERAPIELAREIAVWLAANVAEQVDVLADRGLDALLVIDEPTLSAAAADGVEAAWDALRVAAPAWGLHVCCAVPWDIIERAAPDVLSFDLTLGLDGGGADAVGRLVAGGSRIAWGVVAPHRPEADVEVAGLLDAAIARTGVAGTMSLLTPTCGTGRMAPRREVAVSAALADLARARRRSV
jgi:methionine synthase II (cobalamin-independent)